LLPRLEALALEAMFERDPHHRRRVAFRNVSRPRKDSRVAIEPIGSRLEDPIVDSKTRWRKVRNVALWRAIGLGVVALAVCPIWHLHLGKFAILFWVVSIALFATALFSLIAARDAQTGCAGFSAEP
jgi:hypothetical protein